MTAQFGMSEADLAALVSILRRHGEVEGACVFGSRAKENYKPGSDVDIAVKGRGITHKVIASIRYELNEETLMPYRFDVLNFNTINSKDLIDHINRVGVTIFKRVNGNG